MGMDAQQTVYYINIEGKPVLLQLDEHNMAALTRGQPVLMEQKGENGKEIYLIPDGGGGDLGIPCTLMSEGTKICSRGILKDALARIKDWLPVESFEIACDLYVFPEDGFTENLSEHSSSLNPCVCEGLKNVDISCGGAEAFMVFSPEPKQYELHITGGNVFTVLDALAPARKAVSDICRARGLRPFFAPKIDSFAPCGMVMTLRGRPDIDQELCRAALLGIYDHAKAMTLASCSQVNSYKRITPKRVTPGQRIPCFLRGTTGDDRNAIVKWKPREAEITFYLADNYCNPYLALAGNLQMLSYGVERYKNDMPAGRFEGFLYSGERMPNSLVVASELWKDCAFAKEVYGGYLFEKLYENAVAEWVEYCDIAHPWELMRGAEYELR